jgi:diguanylate cyclase (GGDEF)-like protein
VGDAAVDQFAHMLRGSRSPAEIRAALVYLAHRISGAARVELEIEEFPGRPLSRVAVWPRPEGASGLGSGFADQPEAVATAVPAPASVPRSLTPALVLGLQFEGRIRGQLRLISSRGRGGGGGSEHWPETTLARLETLCVLAAAAELRSARLDEDQATRDSLTGAHNAPYLAAFLTHAMAQARRRVEPLSLLSLALDQSPPLRDRHGSALADATLARAARAITSTLRGSDVVARLEPDRLVAALPGCDASDALRVADAARRAVGEALLTGGVAPAPAAWVGVATYPDHAREPGPLLAAAEEALARARLNAPRGGVQAAPRIAPAPATILPYHRVG